MTTNTWILVGEAVALGLIVVPVYFWFRAGRAKMSRQLLGPFIGQATTAMILALTPFNGMTSVIFMAAIVAIYAPAFYWILKSRHDDHAA